MKTKYQLVILGNQNDFQDAIVNTFISRVTDLGLDNDYYSIIHSSDFNDKYYPKSPSACIYFGGAEPGDDIDELDILIRDAVFILPVVPTLKNFHSLVPKQLGSVNGFELADKDRIEALVGRILEALSLLRASRRLFISYRRVESRSVAIQLYEFLDAQGFDVFLDTHSIRAGDQFQDELWHRLVDTDIVVLLDTEDFLTSEWTEKELARASAVGIAILQLIWPERDQIPYSTLCTPFYLTKEDFLNDDYTNANANLVNQSLKFIGSSVESLRARNLASRQDNLIQEFLSTAKRRNVDASLQHEKFITVKRTDGKEVAIIPTIGVPQSLTYNQMEELIKRIREDNLPEVCLLYDDRLIIEKWQRHLAWLNLHLPVKGKTIVDIENWIENL